MTQEKRNRESHIYRRKNYSDIGNIGLEQYTALQIFPMAKIQLFTVSQYPRYICIYRKNNYSDIGNIRLEQ